MSIPNSNMARDSDPLPAGETPVDYGPQLNRTIWILTTLGAAFLALRVYCKMWRHRGLWWDDWFLIASWVRISIHPSADVKAAREDAAIAVYILACKTL